MRRSRGSRRAALAALFALATGGGSAQTPPAPASLSPGMALERAFAAGESQVFVADLTAGRAYVLAVEQKGIHLVVDVRGPGGEILAAVDSPLDRWGIETVLLRPAAAGTYRVEVHAGTKGVGPGRCEIRLDAIPRNHRGRPREGLRPGCDNPGGHDPAPRADGQPRPDPGGLRGSAPPLPGRRRPAGRGRSGGRPRRRHASSGKAASGRRALSRGRSRAGRSWAGPSVDSRQPSQHPTRNPSSTSLLVASSSIKHGPIAAARRKPAEINAGTSLSVEGSVSRRDAGGPRRRCSALVPIWDSYF
jgi:hypothetical protein